MTRRQGLNVSYIEEHFPRPTPVIRPAILDLRWLNWFRSYYLSHDEAEVYHLREAAKWAKKYPIRTTTERKEWHLYQARLNAKMRSNFRVPVPKVVC